MALPAGQSLHLPRRGDGTIWTPDRAVVPAGIYDLYASDTESRGQIPHAVNWPLAPAQQTTVTATSLSELQSAVNAGARQINYSGASGGALSIQSDDVYINMAAGASIGTLNFNDPAGHARILISCDTPRGASVGSVVMGSNYNNVRFQNLNMGSASAQMDHYDVRRVAWVGCDITTGNNYFAAWPGGAVGSHNNQDWIIANCRITGNTAFGSCRLQHIDRLTIVDSLIDTRNTGYATLRLEFNTNNAWIRNVTCFGGGFTLDPQVGSSRPTATVHDVTYFDCNVYHTGFISITDTQGDLSDPAKVYNITMDDVLFHTDSGTPGSTISGVQGSWNVGIAQYADFTSFPSWSFR